MSRKFLVTEPDEGSVPFLRGILVRSLVHSGLPFEDAYTVADAVRERFQDEDKVPREVLRAVTAAMLREQFGDIARDHYQAPPLSGISPVRVISGSREMPFSEAQLVHSLQACSIDAEAARSGARAVHKVMRERDRHTIHSSTLRAVVARCLGQHVSDEAVRRYLCWRQFKRSGTPLLILIGGITGAGKSTLATELAYRLRIVRTQSTDIMREIIRTMLPKHLYPSLQFSSFEAWRGLPTIEGTPPNSDDDRVLDGFLNQFAAIKVALEATLRRSVVERQDLILEGVHVLPSRLRLRRIGKQSLLVPMVLAKVGGKKLRRQFEFRAERQPGRGAARYLDSFDEICELQSFLLADADRENITILNNDEMEETVIEAMELITQQVMERFDPVMPENADDEETEDRDGSEAAE